MSAKKRQTTVVDEMQLFEQFRRIERALDNIDDTYLLVGSSVISAASNYRPTVPDKDKEQYIFDQMKQIYMRLASVGDDCEKCDPFHVVLEMEHRAIGGLERLRDGSESVPHRSLLETILDRTRILDKKNKVTVIRDGGSRLYHGVLERGPYQGNRNIMLRDYSDIEAAFK